MKYLIGLMFILLAGFACADIISPTEHPVTHNLYIDNIDEYGQYQFFIYPTSMSGGAYLFTSTKIPGFYKFAQPKLYAVLKSDMPANISDEGFVPPEDALVSAEVLSRTDTLPNTDFRTELETHYTVTIEGGTLFLNEVVTPEEPGPDYVMLLVGLGAGLIIGYVAGKKL